MQIHFDYSDKVSPQRLLIFASLQSLSQRCWKSVVDFRPNGTHSGITLFYGCFRINAFLNIPGAMITIILMKMIWNSSHGKKLPLHTCERPNKRGLNSKTGAPFLFRAVGRTMVIRGRFPSPWMSNVRLRYFDIALGIPSTAASSVALYTCMEGGVNITVAYTKLWAGIEARCGSIS